MTCCSSLACLVASKQVWGRAMRIWAHISSLRPLINHSWKRNRSYPPFRNPSAQRQRKNLPLLYIVSTYSNNLNGGCLCQNVHIAQQKIVSKKHTLGVHFYAIATISIVSDPNRECCNKAWSTHR
jgi:hypothetical protein